ncbi:MAG: NADH-quinone oxidoreductase subunit I [FCB group bacterium]
MVRYFNNIWLGLSTILIGMRITISHLFYRNVTVQYPNVHPVDKAGATEMPPNARNRLFLDIDLCNGCNGCVRACPVNCISCETQKITPGDTDVKPLKDGSKRGLWVTDYKIDFAKCCFCGLCTEPCPTEAIKMTPEFEYTKLKREDLIYTFSVMTPEQIQAKKDMYEKFQAEKKKDEEAKKAAAAKEAEKKPDTVS